MFFKTALAGMMLLAAGGVASAETTISVYGGASFSPHSSVDYDFNNGTSGDVTIGWDGASFEMPPYYGVRGTYWFSSIPQVGVAIDFTHAKVKADLDEPDTGDFSTLEFTDGINFLTANLMYRFDMSGTAVGDKLTPYVGIGAGLAIPHVEVNGPSLGQETREYQVTGVAAQALVGVDYAFTDNWSAFAEFKSGYAQVDADLNGGGSLETDIIANQVLVGITYKLF